MAWKSPIERFGNKELLSEKRFYRLLSEQMNYIDPESTFLFYIGLVTLVSDELRKNKVIRLPHLGDFALVEQKPRPAWIGRIHAIIGSKEVLKFYPKERLRRYFNKRQTIRCTEILPPKAFR